MYLTLWMGFILTFRFCCIQARAPDVNQKQDYGSQKSLNILVFQQTTGNPDKVQHGTDVTMSCKLPSPASTVQSFTLKWERDGAPVPNTTLFLNNTAFLLLHNIDLHNKGTYTCKMWLNGKVEMQGRHLLNVMDYTHSQKNYVYRESSDSSDLSLICKSSKFYTTMRWTWQQNQKSNNKIIMKAEDGSKPIVNGTIESGKHSTTNYSGNKLIFHISPVKFSYNGIYRCVTPKDTKNNTYSTLILHTLRVFAEPPGCVFRNQSVVLTCELSSVTPSVTVVWLRMEGNRAVWVQQKVLSEKENLSFTVTVNNISEKQLHWQCGVFNEYSLRALAPITLNICSGNTVIIVACAVTVCVVMVLLGLLVFYCQRKSSAGVPHTTERKPRNPPENLYSVYRDDGHVAMVKAEGEEEELHYASITVLGFRHGAGGNRTRNKKPKISDSVIYSNIRLK